MKAVCDFEASGEGDHLYVMSASGGMLHGLIKVGRSKNPCQRALELQESQPYHIEINAVFWGAGSREKIVHGGLSAFRVAGAPGTEWFEIPISNVCVAISRMLFSGPVQSHRSRRACLDDEAEVAAEPGE